ncbi:MAG: peptidoglycan bridge formation glycyltransferase FemA/FemB family protein [Candidatus Daviesbacteria bacterium]|nr:peptidoglycan bridge formation glycyltransferase FemA/FemB family protein [Candidatus Daviesbacteria bacterium]
MDTTVKEITKKQVWEDFLSQHPEANFLQSWNWGSFHEALNHKIKRSGFYEKGNLIGAMLSVVENAKRGKYLTVPGGPTIDWQNKNLVKQFVEEIKKIAKEENCVFIRVRPQIKSDDFSKNLFKELGFKTAPMHLHAELTSQLDITPAEETLLANMRKATRYEIKKAISSGIKIETTNGAKTMHDFYDLQLLTAKRQKFVPFSFKFLAEQFKIFLENQQAVLFSAKFENKLLAQAFIIFYGTEAAYHYGASTEKGRKYPGAYLIQWEAIKEAKKRGFKRYNFWGVSPEGDKDHRFSGLSLFKRGFGGSDFEYLHAQDLIINYPRYLLNYSIEFLRKKIRRV